MATQLLNLPSSIRFSARAVGNAFIDFYYNTLQLCPHKVQRLYTEASKLTRADGDVEIHQELFALEYGNFKVEMITSLDYSELHPGCWIVMVTGSVVTKAKSCRAFVQTFVLAQKEVGYFVLNDIFRYVNKGESPVVTPASAAVYKSPQQRQDHISTTSTSMIEVGYKELSVWSQPSETGEQEDREKLKDAEVTVPTKLEEDSKEENSNQARLSSASFASILLKGNAAGPSVAFTTHATKLPGSAVAKQHAGSSWCIFVRNLPLSISIARFKEQFKKFGSLKSGGVDIKRQGCYAFVEFKEKDSAEAAIRASPISIDGRMVYIEQKKYGSTSW